MAMVIVAGALGVIIITGGLFLRRLLSELAQLHSQLAEARRQITGIDRQMRAQRAHVTFLRQLLTDDEDQDDGDGDDSRPSQAAVVNGSTEPPPGPAPGMPEPVRRKRHLGLYVGGAAAALATIGAGAREAIREYRGQLIGAATGVAVTATTVTMVTVQPWTDDHGQAWPSSAPTASASPMHSPPPFLSSQPPGSPPPSATWPSPSPSETASSSPTETGSPSARPDRTFRPWIGLVREETPVAETSLPAPASSGGDTPIDSTGSGSPTGTRSPPAPSPSPSAPPPSVPPPPGEAMVDPLLELDVSVEGLLGLDACLLC